MSDAEAIAAVRAGQRVAGEFSIHAAPIAGLCDFDEEFA